MKIHPPVIIVVIFFRIILDFVYIRFVHPTYVDSFLSFNFNFDGFQYLISWCLFLSSIVIVSNRFNKFSDLFFLDAILSLVAPLTSVYGLDANKALLPVLTTIGSVYLAYIVSVSSFLKILYIPSIKNARLYAVLLAFAMVGYLLVWGIMSGSTANFNLDFRRVYEFRSINSAMLDIGVLAYLNLWVYKFFTIFLLAIALYNRKYYFVVLIICIQVFIFGITSHKAVLLYPFLVLAIWFILSRTDRLIAFPLLYSSIVVVTYVIFVVFGYNLPAAVFVRRALYVPAGLTFVWFDYFSEHPHVYWTDRLLSFLIEYPYELNIPHTVGEHLHGVAYGANNGYISSGFAHAGLSGTLIYSLLLGYLLRYTNVIGRKVRMPLWFLPAIVFVPFRIALISSDLLTSITSHGIGISMLILTFYKQSVYKT